jgi:hypothetical protein
MGLVKSAFSKTFHMQWHRDKKVYAICIPKLKEGLLGKTAQRLSKRSLSSVLKEMNSLHKASIIYPKGPCPPEIPLFKKALGTGVAFPFPRNKREAASCAKWGRDGRKTSSAGVAKVWRRGVRDRVQGKPAI